MWTESKAAGDDGFVTFFVSHSKKRYPKMMKEGEACNEAIFNARLKQIGNQYELSQALKVWYRPESNGGSWTDLIKAAKQTSLADQREREKSNKAKKAADRKMRRKEKRQRKRRIGWRGVYVVLWVEAAVVRIVTPKRKKRMGR